MIYFTEKGLNHDEVMKVVHDKYGPDAQIYNTKRVSIGGFLGLFSKEGYEVSGFTSYNTRPVVKKDDKKEKEKILEDLKGNKKQGEDLQEILAQVKSLKEDLKSVPANETQAELPSIEAAETYLFENDFSLSYIKKSIKRLKSELSYDDLNDTEFVLDRLNHWIEESIVVFKEVRNSKSNVVILVGPTGVGKTTTIAKLAAMKGFGTDGGDKHTVRMITIDNYRIGAAQQIETYGEIMGIPVTCCNSYEEIKEEIDNNSDVDFIFVDTIGKSPKDIVELAEMRKILEGCGHDCSVHLAFSATTKTFDLREIMKQYKSFDYDSVIITKIDETTRCGSLISLIDEQKQKVSYITTGQMVPQDIKVASKKMLMSLLIGNKR